jgi:ADP-ribose pyrophosphatase YjhB (NUDIX family)
MLNTIQKLTRTVWRNLPASIRVGLVRRTQRKFTVSATAIITNASGEVLLLDHVFRPFSGWALPGGFLASDEQADEAVIREIQEEIGIGLSDLKIHYAQTHRQHIEIFFVANPVGTPKVNSREIIGFGWFKPTDLPENMSCTQKRLIVEVLDGRV